jgi:hypothetical protein
MLFVFLVDLIFVSEKSRQNSPQDAAHPTPSPGFPVGYHPYSSCSKLAPGKGYDFPFKKPARRNFDSEHRLFPLQ